MVAFLACCAHPPAVGPYVTAAWVILRRRRSRKKSTKTSRNRMSYVWTKSHAHVTWLRRNVDQPWPVAWGAGTADVRLDGPLADADAERELLAAESLCTQ